MSSTKVLILKSQTGDWEGLFIHDTLIDEGHTLGEGDTLYILKQSELYNFKFADVSIKTVTDEDEAYLCDCGNFPAGLSELEGNY